MSRTMIDDAHTTSRARPPEASPETAETAADTGSETSPVIPAPPGLPDRRPLVVRRHGSLSALIGLGASGLSGLYLVRAVDQGGTGSWAVGLVLGVLALFHLTQWVDSRTPLLVADDTGVRLRLGNVWHGLLWDDVDRVAVRPRQGLFKDGRVVVHPADDTALSDLNRRSRRRLAANTRMYGAPFALPLGLTTVASTDDLAGSLEALATAGTRVEVVEVHPATGPRPEQPVEDPAAAAADEAVPHAAAVDADGDLEAGADPDADTNPNMAPVEVQAEPVDAAPPAPDPTREPTPGHEPEPTPEPSPAPEPAPGPEPLPTPEPGPGPDPGPSPRPTADAPARASAAETDAVEPDAVDPVPVGEHVQPELSDDPVDEPPQPLRPVRRARRAEITRPPMVRTSVHGQLALQEPPPELDVASDAASDAANDPADDPVSRDEDEQAGRRRATRVRGNMSLVLDEPADASAQALLTPEAEPEPAPVAQPVIGPVITEARELLDLTVDELAVRTRIRPHVIEAIEVDDFGPCAGDFYARGHLRALGRVLGIDAEPLVATYEERYATEPITASRVFEAELAGDAGAFRGVGTATGPRWGALLVAVVLLALFWGLAGYFLDDTAGSADDVPDRSGVSAPFQPGAGR